MTERELERLKLLTEIGEAIERYKDFELGERGDREQGDKPLTLESLRDWVVVQGPERWWKRGDAQDAFTDATVPQITRRIRQLEEEGTVTRRGNRQTTRYCYVADSKMGAAAEADVERHQAQMRPEREAVVTNGRNGHVKRGTPMPLLRAPNVGNKESQELVDACHRAGWVAERGTKHVKVKVPSGRTITIPSTPSDHRSLDNAKAILRSEGLQL